ncbi:MAG TPA: 5-oxoprolinase subunit PxpB [Puia sp.]|nr:5-oxoprolinase subunit PxpB [Puia sp.]
MAGSFSYSIFPLGDSAVTLDIGDGKGIDEQNNIRALALHDWLQTHRFPGIVDIIVAYSSVSVFYDTAVVITQDQTAFSRIKALLTQAWQENDGVVPATVVAEGRLIRLPVCYEAAYAPDLEWVARETGLSCEEVINIHCAGPYRVYMIGFLPGFSYLGRVDPRLELPRKKFPVTVQAGGVGIAGMQTGVYPLNSPGGWQIIGRTPVRLFDPGMDPPVVLQTGDRVQFYPVGDDEFHRIRASGIVSRFA